MICLYCHHEIEPSQDRVHLRYNSYAHPDCYRTTWPDEIQPVPIPGNRVPDSWVVYTVVGILLFAFLLAVIMWATDGA